MTNLSKTISFNSQRINYFIDGIDTVEWQIHAELMAYKGLYNEYRVINCVYVNKYTNTSKSNYLCRYTNNIKCVVGKEPKNPDSMIIQIKGTSITHISVINTQLTNSFVYGQEDPKIIGFLNREDLIYTFVEPYNDTHFYSYVHLTWDEATFKINKDTEPKIKNMAGYCNNKTCYIIVNLHNCDLIEVTKFVFLRDKLKSFYTGFSEKWKNTAYQVLQNGDILVLIHDRSGPNFNYIYKFVVFKHFGKTIEIIKESNEFILANSKKFWSINLDNRIKYISDFKYVESTSLCELQINYSDCYTIRSLVKVILYNDGLSVLAAPFLS
jgi:hypothetical protein